MMTFDNEHELKKIKKLHPNAQGEFRRPSILEIAIYFQLSSVLLLMIANQFVNFLKSLVPLVLIG